MAECTQAERDFLDAWFSPNSRERATKMADAKARIMEERLGGELIEAAVRAAMLRIQAHQAGDKAWKAINERFPDWLNHEAKGTGADGDIYTRAEWEARKRLGIKDEGDK